MRVFKGWATAAALPQRLWIDWAAWMFFGGWLLVGGYLAFQQHAAFHTHVFDTGYYTQVRWNTSRGDWFANSLEPRAE